MTTEKGRGEQVVAIFDGEKRAFKCREKPKTRFSPSASTRNSPLIH
jgi:hypothetical protein